MAFPHWGQDLSPVAVGFEIFIQLFVECSCIFHGSLLLFSAVLLGHTDLGRSSLGSGIVEDGVISPWLWTWRLCFSVIPIIRSVERCKFWVPFRGWRPMAVWRLVVRLTCSWRFTFGSKWELDWWLSNSWRLLWRFGNWAVTLTVWRLAICRWWFTFYGKRKSDWGLGHNLN